jgi:16S rRNA processing protein RimM
MKTSADELMEVGVVVGTHGIRGDLKVRPLPTGELALAAVRDLLLRAPSGQLTLYHAQRSTPHRQFVLIRLEGLYDVNEAKSLVGQTLLMRRDSLPDPGEGRHYWCDLEGLTVIDRRRGEIGKVEEMFSTPAHDILVVRSPRGEVLVPAIPPFICQVDPDAGELQVDLPDGLVPFVDEI